MWLESHHKFTRPAILLEIVLLVFCISYNRTVSTIWKVFFIDIERMHALNFQSGLYSYSLVPSIESLGTRLSGL